MGKSAKTGYWYWTPDEEIDVIKPFEHTVAISSIIAIIWNMRMILNFFAG
jgi:hypothetical protein